MEHDFEPLEPHEPHVVYGGESYDENRYHISAAGLHHEGHRSGIGQVAGNGSRMYEGLMHGEIRKSANSVRGPRVLDCLSTLGLDHMDKGNTC